MGGGDGKPPQCGVKTADPDTVSSQSRLQRGCFSCSVNAGNGDSSSVFWTSIQKHLFTRVKLGRHRHRDSSQLLWSKGLRPKERREKKRRSGLRGHIGSHCRISSASISVWVVHPAKQTSREFRIRTLQGWYLHGIEDRDAPIDGDDDYSQDPTEATGLRRMCAM